MKKYMSFILCACLLLLSLAGCNKPTDAEPTEAPTNTHTEPTLELNVEDFTIPEMVDEVILENDLYSIERTDNKCYITIKNFVPVSSSGCHPTEDGRILCGDGPLIVTGDTFDGVEYFIDTVCVTGLNEEQVQSLAILADSRGRVEICELSRVYTPIFPEDFEWDGKVYWSGGKTYGYRLTTPIKEYEDDIVLNMFPDESALNDRLSEIPDETYDDPEREGVICYGEKFEERHYSNAKYEFSSNGISYTVFEKYYNVRNIPYKIDLYGSIGDVDFHYEIPLRTFGHEEKPSKEWLEQFYLKLYEK